MTGYIGSMALSEDDIKTIASSVVESGEADGIAKVAEADVEDSAISAEASDADDVCISDGYEMENDNAD